MDLKSNVENKVMFLNKEIQVITMQDKNYPKNLFELKNPPKKLYAIGNIELLNEFSLAIVGARKCEEESLNLATILAENFVKLGITIISGLAIGIDTAAHEGTLNSNGKTVAVLGSGFNKLYPKCNKELSEKIVDNNGLVISEYEPDTPPLKPNFVNRNRIIAALSSGVIVIEASEKSGSISTAKVAMNLKKKIFTVPGDRYNENFKGNNKLLVQGAKAVLEYGDVLKEYEKIVFKKIKKEKTEAIDIPIEYINIYNCIKKKPKNVNQISLELAIPVQVLSSKLTFMEIERICEREDWWNV